VGIRTQQAGALTVATAQQVRDGLHRALAQYGAADSPAEVALAILAMHTALETAFRACLEGAPVPAHTREALQEPGGIRFPDLVDLVGDYTDILGTDPSARALLVSLNTTRARIAHPTEKLPQEQIAKDARQLAEVVVVLWLRMFPDSQPPSLGPASSTARADSWHTPALGRAAPRAADRVATERHTVSDTQPRSSALGLDRAAAPNAADPDGDGRPESERPRSNGSILLRSLWRGQPVRSRWLLKLLIASIAALVASEVWNWAVALARWPAPVKPVSLLLAVLTLGLAFWSAGELVRAVWAVGLRRILVAVTVVYALSLVAHEVAASGEHGAGRAILESVQAVNRSASTLVMDFARSIASAPADFRFAYTGRRSPFQVPGMPAHPAVPEGTVRGSSATAVESPPAPADVSQASQASGSSGQPDSEGLRIGDTVTVVGMDGQPLTARAGPGTVYGVTAGFDEGSLLVVLEGPADGGGYTWWRVRGDGGEGWCADRWLVPVR
jgi:hypothetical protein